MSALPPETRIAFAVIAVICGAVVGAILASRAPAAHAPERVMVSGSEFSLTLSRARVARGEALIQFLNRGEDDHDLRLRRITRRAGAPTARWPVSRPGRLSELELRLSRGRYRLWCSLPGHSAAGMRATLRVSARR